MSAPLCIADGTVRPTGAAALHPAGPDFLRDTPLRNVKRFFGWTADVARFEPAAGIHWPLTVPACG